MKPPTMDVVPPAVVTSTDLAPDVPAGVRAVSEVPLAFTTTKVAAVPPTFTVAPSRLVPVTVMVVPPANGPPLGVTEAMAGAGTT